MKKNNFFRNFILTMAIILTTISCFLVLEKDNTIWCQEKDIAEPSESKTEIELPDDNIVTVSGEIVYDNYQEGELLLYWSKNIKQTSRPQDIGTRPLILDKPGAFSIGIPKNVGKIYIMSECIKAGEKVAQIISEPVMVTSGDVDVGTLFLEEFKSVIMEDYKGPTVKISGKIISDNYSGGVIHIIVYKDAESYGENLSSGDVAFKSLSRPGTYTIEVPRGIGKVYIFAVDIPTDDPQVARGDMPGTRIGHYKNPLEVKDNDIKGVDIIIDKPI